MSKRDREEEPDLPTAPQSKSSRRLAGSNGRESKRLAHRDGAPNDLRARSNGHRAQVVRQPMLCYRNWIGSRQLAQNSSSSANMLTIGTTWGGGILILRTSIASGRAFMPTG